MRVVSADGRLQADPVIDISDHVNAYWDRGLLGIAVDADFATNRSIYLLYVYEANALDPTGSKTSRLTRIRVTSDNELEDPDAPETVLLGSVAQGPCPAPADTVDCIPADGFSHAIGTVRADPDGTLWLGSGDATSWRGADAQALRTYDERSLSGKIMHVDRQGRGVPGHPFCPAESDLTKVCTKLYAKGFRNPFRFHLRPGAGPVVGRRGLGDCARSSTSPGPAAATGGRAMRARSGHRATRTSRPATTEYAAGPSAHDPPAHEYAQPPGDGTILAGPRYTGEQYPAAYQGAWFFGDYSKGLIWRMTIDAQGGDRRRHPVRLGLRGRRRPRARAQRRPRLRELRRRRGHGVGAAHRLRQPRAAPGRLRDAGAGHRAARDDPERRGHDRPGRGGDDLRVGLRGRRVGGCDRAVGRAHLCRRRPHAPPSPSAMRAGWRRATPSRCSPTSRRPPRP